MNNQTDNSIIIDLNDNLKTGLFLKYIADSKDSITICADKITSDVIRFTFEEVDLTDLQAFKAFLLIL